MSKSLVATGQASKFNDTISIIDSSISDIILYSSNDSIYNDLVGKKFIYMAMQKLKWAT